MKPLEQTLLVSSIIIFSACEGDQLHQIKQELPSALWPLILLTLAWTTHRAVARRRLNRNLNLRYIKKSTTTPSTSLHGATVTTEHRLIIDLLELKLCWTCWDFEAATSREYDLRRSIDGKWQWKET
ncbi:MAG: hypothetical protein MUC96_10115, partial [Myxococcaceae bacterium]|nr:hypothetical protein [Myxococcaceae bacterium]